MNNATIFYYCIKHCLTQKDVLPFNNIKLMNNNKLEETDIKSFTCYYFDVIININYLNLTNALFAEKSYSSF